ncbi:GPI anchored serine-rich protein [Phlyctema vagabunda]|uniref:GPI anchored serine-rich protein n=1 Tax=Phlyctema vagabunda TaxID=108571 RepID=A0ABR4PJV9_9HELO
MRFSVLAVSMLASAVVADQTVYATEMVTITSCAATVTNCPARSTVTSMTSYPVVTSVPAVTSAPATSEAVIPTTSAYHNASSVATSVWTSIPVKESTSENSPEATSYSVIAITSCIPTVIYSTVPVAKPTTSAVVVPVPSSKPIPSQGTGTSGNGTTPSVPTTPATFTGAASTISGSFAVAAAGGLAALLLA